MHFIQYLKINNFLFKIRKSYSKLSNIKIQMIIAILSTIIMGGIAALAFIDKVPKRMLIMSALVSVLILLNIVNEILYYINTNPFDWVESNYLCKKGAQSLQLIALTAEQNQLSTPFISEQYLVLSALKNRLQNGENPIIQLDRINYQRLKQLLIGLKDSIADASHYKFLELDYKKIDSNYQQQHFSAQCLQQSLLTSAKNNKFIILVRNVQKLEHLEALKKIYILPEITVTIIFHKLPHSFAISSLRKLTEISAGKKIDYLETFLHEYPQKKDQILACAEKKQLDFNALIAITNGNLKRYCSMKKKSSPILSCVKSFMQTENSWIPFMKVKSCFQKNNYMGIYEQFEGIKFKDGLVSLQKQYYYADQNNNDIQAL